MIDDESVWSYDEASQICLVNINENLQKTVSPVGTIMYEWQNRRYGFVKSRYYDIVNSYNIFISKIKSAEYLFNRDKRIANLFNSPKELQEEFKKFY